MSCHACDRKAAVTIVSGVDWVQSFEIAPQTRGATLDGWEIVAQLRACLLDAVAIEVSTEAGSLIVIDPAAGRVAINVAGSATRALEPGQYLLDFRLVNAVTGLTRQTATLPVLVQLPVTRV